MLEKLFCTNLFTGALITLDTYGLEMLLTFQYLRTRLQYSIGQFLSVQNPLYYFGDIIKSTYLQLP